MSGPAGAHRAVMVATCVAYLKPRPGAWVIDATFGAGGHSRALLEAGANVLGIDQDPRARQYAATLDHGDDGSHELGAVAPASAEGPEDAVIAPEALGVASAEGPAGAGGPSFLFAAGNFRDMERLAHGVGLSSASGILLDLGVSSMQLDEPGRGFAFRRDGPLDMRMAGSGPSAAEVVNGASMEELAALLWRYGEERLSRRIARRIVEARAQAPILTTARLAEVVASAYPDGHARRAHPARRTFQALRIHVNDELGALQEGLEAAARLLTPGGRLVVLSYHSLEDRIVKRFLNDSPRLTPLTRKPLLPDDDEVRANPRARAAKLRAGERSGA